MTLAKATSRAFVMQEYSSLFDYRAMVGLPTFLTTKPPSSGAR
jgi:hypothetical protein